MHFSSCIYLLIFILDYTFYFILAWPWGAVSQGLSSPHYFQIVAIEMRPWNSKPGNFVLAPPTVYTNWTYSLYYLLCREVSAFISQYNGHDITFNGGLDKEVPLVHLCVCERLIWLQALGGANDLIGNEIVSTYQFARESKDNNAGVLLKGAFGIPVKHSY